MIDNEFPLALPFLGIWARTVGYPAGAVIFEEKPIRANPHLTQALLQLKQLHQTEEKPFLLSEYEGI